ncbi:MAG: cytochrome P460 family protein [Thermoanaerobaculia bacterium]
MKVTMKAIAAAAVALAVCAVLRAAPRPGLSDFKELRDYSSWQEVTSGPHKVLPEISAACAPPIPPEPDLPHPGAVDLQGKDRFIRVFASSPAASLMREPRVESYPVGSVVAKVKLIEGSAEPTGVAFMIKRESGYNPKGRDWEYLVFEGKPLRLSARGVLSTCQGCHGEQTYTDGLYRSYLSDGNVASKGQ